MASHASMGVIEERTALAEHQAAQTFDSFYREAWLPVYRAVALGLGDFDLAAEAVDEAMTRCYERWTKVRSMANPRGWVFRVAMNWGRSRLRRRTWIGRDKVPDIPFHDPDIPDPQLVVAIHKLSHAHREVVVARYLLDMSEAEMAAAFGVPNGTVKSRLNRALKELKEAIE